MVQIIFPPERPIFTIASSNPVKEFYSKYLTIFLGGTIEMGNSYNWQKDITENIKNVFGERDDIYIFNPRRLDFDKDQEQSINNEYFNTQVNWELDYLDLCQIRIFNFEPNTLSPISIGEFTQYGLTKPDSILLRCDDEYKRKGNIEIMSERFGIKNNGSFRELKKQLYLKIAEWTIKKDK